MKMHDLPNELKPREKALQHGIESLTDIELLALLIGSGIHGHSAMDIAHELLRTYLSLPLLSKTNLNSLIQIPGLSKVRALSLLAVFEFQRRTELPFFNQLDTINSVQDIVERYRRLERLDHEVLVIVCLNKRHKILREFVKYKGTSTSFAVSAKEVVTELLNANARYYILIHNHPDANQMPSENDIRATFQIVEKAREFDIDIFDHIIIYPEGYFSFKESGIIEKSLFRVEKNIYKTRD